MMSASEMEGIKAQIMAIVVPDSEDVFDDSNESEALQITARIACDFFGFLQSNGVPELREAEYLAETIRDTFHRYLHAAD